MVRDWMWALAILVAPAFAEDPPHRRVSLELYEPGTRLIFNECDDSGKEILNGKLDGIVTGVVSEDTFKTSSGDLVPKFVEITVINDPSGKDITRSRRNPFVLSRMIGDDCTMEVEYYSGDLLLRKYRLEKVKTSSPKYEVARRLKAGTLWLGPSPGASDMPFAEPITAEEVAGVTLVAWKHLVDRPDASDLTPGSLGFGALTLRAGGIVAKP